MLAMLALARCCLMLFFSINVLSGPVGLCNEPGPPVSFLGAVMGLGAIPKGCLPLPVYCMLPVYLSLSLGHLGGSLLRLHYVRQHFCFGLFKFQAARFS